MPNNNKKPIRAQTLTMPILAIALLFIAWWAYGERQARLQTAMALEASYQREFYNLVNQLDQVQSALSKGLVSGSPQKATFYFTEVWNRALDAQLSLSQLPLEELNLSASRKFLAQLGDYSYYIARNLSSGRDLSDSEFNQLHSLYQKVEAFARDIHGIEEQLSSKGFRWTALNLRPKGIFSRKALTLNRDMAVTPNYQSQTVVSAASSSPSLASEPNSLPRLSQEPRSDLDGFMRIDRGFQELPALIYDGPFSDHLERRQPLGLTGPIIDQARARQIAERFVDKSIVSNFQATSVATTAGAIPSFSVTVQSTSAQAPAPLRLDVSRKGGHVVWMLNPRTIRTRKLDAAEAVDKAKRFLESRGFTGFQETSSVRQDNVQVITFAPIEKGVLLYPDTVKVKVALDNGEIVGFDALGYLMAHRPRELPSPGISESQALGRISRRAKPSSVKLALIPLDSGREVLSYEISASRGPDRFLIYINAVTGNEEQIFRVIKTPDGTFTM